MFVLVYILFKCTSCKVKGIPYPGSEIILEDGTEGLAMRFKGIKEDLRETVSSRHDQNAAVMNASIRPNQLTF